MAVPAMATTWQRYDNRSVNPGQSAVVTGVVTKVNGDIRYATFVNEETYAQNNPNFKTSVSMRAFAGISGTNVAASATVGYGGQKNGSFGTGYGGAGSVYRLGLYNTSTSIITSTGRWTPY